jgi:hypothetical protein
VTITESPADEHTPHMWTVRPFWTGVDRPEGVGYGCTTLKVAERLKAAMLAGAVFYDIKIGTDVNGKTYVSAPSRVLARMMNADLNRLGF